MGFEDIYLLIVSIILIAAPILDWTAFAILHRASSQKNNGAIALRERSRMALVLSVGNSISGLLAIIRLAAITLGPLFVVLLGISLVLSSVPNAYWLYLYFSKRMKKS